MTPEEIAPSLGKNVRVFVDDGKILAGRLEQSGSGYTVVQPPATENDQEKREAIESAGRINQIEDAPELG